MDTKGDVYSDLNVMVLDMVNYTWEFGTIFRYEDPNDTTINCELQVTASECKEMRVRRDGVAFESFTVSWMEHNGLLEDLLDILGSTPEECKKFETKGNYRRLPGEYTKYAKDFILN